MSPATKSFRAWLDAYAHAEEGEILIAEGLDVAIIGVTAYQPGRSITAVYDYEKCVRVFRAQGMTDDEAREWMEFNVVGAWVGETTPIFLVTPRREDRA